MNRLLLAITFTATLVGCDQPGNEEGQVKAVAEVPYKLRETIYHGGDIITMEGDEPLYVEAVVQREGKIIFAGSKAAAFDRYAGKAKEFNLNGETMLPGLIEPHVHPSLAAVVLSNEVIAPYDWVMPDGVKRGSKTPEEYIKRLTDSVAANASADKMYFVWGYHQLWHGDLSREMLNKISPDKPVGVIHRSFHEIFLNDKAIQLLGIKEEDFKGNPQVIWGKGHFFEGGWLALVPKIGPMLFKPASYKHGLEKMTQLVRKNGITTIAEPGFPSADFNIEYTLLKTEMDKKPPYDVYLIPNGTQLYSISGNSNEKALEAIEAMPLEYNTPNIIFLPKQIKLFSDGAIYSLLMQMKEGYLDGHHGEWMTPLDLLQEQLSLYWKQGYKIHVHANGDLGIQQVLDFNRADQEKLPRDKHRLTLHHMGYFDEDIAKEISELGIDASVNPYYLWALADKYSEFGLGKERAESLVRIKSLTDENIPVSFHSDFAMAPMEPLTLAWTAVNRETAEHSRFSQEQRIDVFTAMQGITIHAARTLDLENEIGSIKEGKRANFAILKENPFKADPMRLKDIVVSGTVYEGQFHINKTAHLRSNK